LATLFSFPAGAEASAGKPPFTAQRPAPARGPVDIRWVARRLEIQHLRMRAVIDAIRLLVENEGFPEPKSPRFVKGARQRGKNAVWSKSTWNRDEAEAWFDDDLPPAAAQASAAANRSATRHRLAERARQVAGVAA
jgi:hypothetical protein